MALSVFAVVSAGIPSGVAYNVQLAPVQIGVVYLVGGIEAGLAFFYCI